MVIHRNTLRNSNTWLYKAIHGYTWQYIVKHGHTWLNTVTHSNTLLYTAIHGYTWQYVSMNKWMKSRGWEDDRPLTIHFYMWTVSSDVSIQRRHWQPLSVHLWAPRTLKVDHSTGVYVPYSFRTVVWVLLRPSSQISVSAVRRNLRFFVLIRED